MIAIVIAIHILSAWLVLLFAGFKENGRFSNTLNQRRVLVVVSLVPPLPTILVLMVLASMMLVGIVEVVDDLWNWLAGIELSPISSVRRLIRHVKEMWYSA